MKCDSWTHLLARLARCLSQFGGYQGIITCDHHHLLQPKDRGTHLTQREDYRGLYGWFRGVDRLKLARSKFDRALRAEVLRRQRVSR